MINPTTNNNYSLRRCMEISLENLYDSVIEGLKERVISVVLAAP